MIRQEYRRAVLIVRESFFNLTKALAKTEAFIAFFNGQPGFDAERFRQACICCPDKVDERLEEL